MSVLINENNQIEEHASNSLAAFGSDTSTSVISCLKCDTFYQFPVAKDFYLAHLYAHHRLIIADVNEIANLEKYLIFWVEKFRDAPLSAYCVSLTMKQLPDGTPTNQDEYYYMLCGNKVDVDIRKELQWERLAGVLKQYHFECNDKNFQKECLFCRNVIKGLRGDYLKHLFEKHIVNVGRPNKLVYIEELIAKLEYNMEQLICLFCERTFVSRDALKNHMRKKNHRRINSRNQTYDKFYLENYYEASQIEYKQRRQANTGNIPTVHVESQRRRKQKKHATTTSTNRGVEKEEELDDDDSCSDVTEYDDDVDDDDDAEIERFMCLYCVCVMNTYETLKSHMLTKHKIDFQNLIQPFNIYQRIKLVNFIRRQNKHLICSNCNQKFENEAQLYEHIDKESHHKVVDISVWNTAENLKPFLGDDALLQVLDENDDDNDYVNDADIDILVEDLNVEIGSEIRKLKLDEMAASSDADYADWLEEEPEQIKCLYCKQTKLSLTALKVHMLIMHQVDFQTVIQPLTIYQRIKLVNFMRNQINNGRCFNCNESFDERVDDLYAHIEQEMHYDVGEHMPWDLSCNLLPPTEHDSLLYLLDDEETDFVNDPNFEIIAESAKIELSEAARRMKLECSKLASY